MRRPTAKVENESQQQQAHDGDNLDAREAEFGFSVNRHGEDVEADHEDDDDDNPCGNVDMLRTRPELDDHGRRGDFGAESYRRRVPILLMDQMMDGAKGLGEPHTFQPTANPMASSTYRAQN